MTEPEASSRPIWVLDEITQEPIRLTVETADW